MANVKTPAFDVRSEMAEDPDYRPVCGLAVAGLLIGLASVAAFFGGALWPVAVLAIIVNLVALRRVAHSQPRMIGRGAALMGLFVAVFCFVGGVGNTLCANWIVERQTLEVGDAWFDALRKGNIYQAHQLTREPKQRDFRKDDLAKLYASNPTLANDIKEYRDNIAVKKLLSLDGKFQVRWQSQQFSQIGGRKDQVFSVYELTFDNQGKPETHLLRLAFVRTAEFRHSLAGWHITMSEYDYEPPRSAPR